MVDYETLGGGEISTNESTKEDGRPCPNSLPQLRGSREKGKEKVAVVIIIMWNETKIIPKSNYFTKKEKKRNMKR